MNDPTTALTCVDYLRRALEELAARQEPCVLRRFGDASAAVERRTFRDHLAEAFLDIGRHAGDEIRVTHAVLVALASIAEAAIVARARARVADVVELAERIGAHGLSKVPSVQDRELLEDALSSIRTFRDRAVPA